MALNINGTTGISGVDGSVSAPAVTGTDSNTGITFPAADTIKFSTGGVERMAITNSGVSGISTGLSVATIWRVHTTWSGAADPVINWEQADNSYDGNIGTMSESSGIFSFPSTGMYGIMWRMAPYSSSYQRHMSHYIKVTTDGTNYNTAARGDFTIVLPSTSNNHMGGEPIHCIFDVTNTSTHKVKFTSSSGPSYNGNGTYNNSYAQFIRYGDT